VANISHPRPDLIRFRYFRDGLAIIEHRAQRRKASKSPPAATAVQGSLKPDNLCDENDNIANSASDFDANILLVHRVRPRCRKRALNEQFVNQDTGHAIQMQTIQVADRLHVANDNRNSPARHAIFTGVGSAFKQIFKSFDRHAFLAVTLASPVEANNYSSLRHGREETRSDCSWAIWFAPA